MPGHSVLPLSAAISFSGNREIRQPTKVDLDRPPRHQPKFRNEEILDLPIPSSVKPSTLELSEVRNQVTKRAKSPVYPFHRKETSEKSVQNVDSDKQDPAATMSQKDSTNYRKESGDYFYEKQTKHSASNYENPTKFSKFCEGFDFVESKQCSHSTTGFSYKREKIENTKANLYNIGFNTARNFSPTQGSMTLNENTSPNVNSLYQSEPVSSNFAHNNMMKRKINLFELNIFEDVKRTRQEELLLSKQKSTPTSYQTKKIFLESKHGLPQTHQKPKFGSIEEQV